MPPRWHGAFAVARALASSIVALTFVVLTAFVASAQATVPEPATAVTAAPLPAPAVTEAPAVPLVTPSPAIALPTPTPHTGRRLAAYRVTADRIAFYSNRFIVGADGHVALVLGDGTRVSGKTFFMDLRLNRFVIAGDVTVRAAGREIHGAAFAEYFNFDRAYFVPILSEPDRWTFVAGDYAHPALGRQMPGDTFFLPRLDGERVFLYAKRATIDPNESVRFAPAKINFGLTFVPFPSYFLDFSQNPNFAQNALSGAYADGPLDFAGGPHGLATAHIRYDAADGIFPSYEQHQITENGYLVGSINPLTRPLKQYNLLGSDRISPGLQTQFFFQEIAFQHGFSQPLSATAFAQLQATGGLPHSYLQLALNLNYDSLLGRPANGLYYGDPTHDWVPNHPTNATLSWIGFRQRVDRLPLHYQLRSSVGFAHDGITPLQTLGNDPNYHSVYSKAIGIDVTTDAIPVVKDPRHRDVYFTATVDKQRQYFSSPHHIDTTTSTVSFTKLVDPQKLALLFSYTNQTVGDYYGAQQSIAYANAQAAINPVTGERFPGYASFRGFATTRSFAQQLVYTPTTTFALNLSLRENRDYPQPVPGAPVVVGDTIVFNNFGATPYQATLDVRYRFNRLIFLDVGRSYYFNFGGYERWQPQFTFQLEK